MLQDAKAPVNCHDKFGAAVAVKITNRSDVVVDRIKVPAADPATPRMGSTPSR